MRRLVACAALALACHRPPATSSKSPSDAGVPAPPPSAPSGEVGLQVVLPDEWSFFAAADGSLRAGPKGRTVLRLDPAPAGAQMVTPDQLFHSFEAGLSGLSAQLIKTEQSADFAAAQIALIHERAGKGVQHRAFVGAKRLGGRVFLCASAPGSSNAEVAAAADTCRALSTRERNPGH